MINAQQLFVEADIALNQLATHVSDQIFDNLYTKVL